MHPSQTLHNGTVAVNRAASASESAREDLDFATTQVFSVFNSGA
jgi:hypothetical protein